jgi:hypothetical protein
MVRVPRFVPVIALVSALCTSNAYAAPSSASLKITLKAKVSKDFIFMSDLIAALKTDGVNCTNHVKNPGVIGVREEGTCSFNKVYVTVDLFTDDKSGVAIINAVKGMAGGYVVGTKNWCLFVDDAASAKILLDGLKLKL